MQEARDRRVNCSIISGGRVNATDELDENYVESRRFTGYDVYVCMRARAYSLLSGILSNAPVWYFKHETRRVSAYRSNYDFRACPPARASTRTRLEIELRNKPMTCQISPTLTRQTPVSVKRKARRRRGDTRSLMLSVCSARARDNDKISASAPRISPASAGEIQRNPTCLNRRALNYQPMKSEKV